jgi:hypothetical protein
MVSAHGHMARGGHGLLKVLTVPAMPAPSTVVSGVAHPQGRRPVTFSYPFAHPTPYASASEGRWPRASTTTKSLERGDILRIDRKGRISYIRRGPVYQLTANPPQMPYSWRLKIGPSHELKSGAGDFITALTAGVNCLSPETRLLLRPWQV